MRPAKTIAVRHDSPRNPHIFCEIVKAARRAHGGCACNLSDTMFAQFAVQEP
jgi:hypothetical protein